MNSKERRRHYVMYEPQPFVAGQRDVHQQRVWQAIQAVVSVAHAFREGRLCGMEFALRDGADACEELWPEHRE